MRAIDFERMILAWMHEPPDRALEPSTAASNAVRYASLALGRPVRAEELSWRDEDYRVAHGAEDLVTARIERAASQGRARADGGHSASLLTLFHPLAGCRWQLTFDRRSQTDEDITQALQEALGAAPGSDLRLRFSALWRLLPESLTRISAAYAHLPADRHAPDSSIWARMDTAAALEAAWQGEGGPGFLSFSIGPVQPFIAAARTTRDLWTGSFLLSWLVFEAMIPVIARCGPASIVFPSLRGNPLMDRWLQKQGIRFPSLEGDGSGAQEARASALSPSLPNTFLALVPLDAGGTTELEVLCREAVHAQWRQIAETVRTTLDQQRGWRKLCADWDYGWDEQIQEFWNLQTAVLPWKAASSVSAGGLAELLESARSIAALQALGEVLTAGGAARRATAPGDAGEGAAGPCLGLWQTRMELVGGAIDAIKRVRFAAYPSPRADGYRDKCTMLGTLAQMGPPRAPEDGHPNSTRVGVSERQTPETLRGFWNRVASDASLGELRGTRIGPRDRLSAVGLVKRFAWSAFFSQELGHAASDRRFEDTATIAAARWLKRLCELQTTAPVPNGDVPLDIDRLRAQGHPWNGTWLHWQRPDEDPDTQPCPSSLWRIIQDAKRLAKDRGLGDPPRYLAVLILDGDRMGEWLQGQHTPRLRDAYSSEGRQALDTILASVAADAAPLARQALDAPKPVTPEVQAAISTALGNFSLRLVPEIVRRHDGVLVYSGGDDVLAFLPTETALQCTYELRQAFRGEPPHNGGAPSGYVRSGGRDLLVMGPRATLSAGLAIVHYTHDLRAALSLARSAEQRAKRRRDRLALTVAPRSGGQLEAEMPWSTVPTLTGLVSTFMQGASFDVHQGLEALRLVPLDAVAGQILRIAERSGDRRRPEGRELQTRLEQQALALWQELRTSGADGTGVDHYVALLQATAFLARGKEGLA